MQNTYEQELQKKILEQGAVFIKSSCQFNVYKMKDTL